MSNDNEKESLQWTICSDERLKIYQEKSSLNRFNETADIDKAFELFNYFTASIVKKNIFYSEF